VFTPVVFAEEMANPAHPITGPSVEKLLDLQIELNGLVNQMKDIEHEFRDLASDNSITPNEKLAKTNSLIWRYNEVINRILEKRVQINNLKHQIEVNQNVLIASVVILSVVSFSLLSLAIAESYQHPSPPTGVIPR
jgi:ectoine hydroxylase-related dioxygenase (phytanoyl-CoA dioxygenase family)